MEVEASIVDGGDYLKKVSKVVPLKGGGGGYKGSMLSQPYFGQVLG